MRDLGSLWKQCHDGTIPKGEWDYERKLTIDGVVYYDEDIIKVEHEKALTGDTISLGNAVASKIVATVIPRVSYTVRKNGEIKLELRVVTLSNGVSDWYEFRYFYIDNAKREADKWNIIGYDKLYSLEVPFPASEGQTFSVTQALNVITNHMGVSIDERSLPFVVRNDLTGLENYSMREVLGYLGSLNFGNWHITEENKLHLIRFGIDNSNYEVGANNSKRLISSTTMKFDKVVVKYGQSPSDKFEVGSGDNEIEIFNPWADPAMADDIYYVLQDYTFYPGETRSTEIDPAVELGDTITVDGNKINLWQIDYSTRMYADIYTPVDTETFTQYQFDAVSRQEIQDIKDRLDALEGGGDPPGDDCILLDNSDLRYMDIYDWYYYFTLDMKTGYNCYILPESTQGSKERLVIEVKTDDLNIDDEAELKIINHSSNGYKRVEFRYGSEQVTLDLSEFDTSNMISMEQMFSETSFGNIDLSNFNTSNVIDMSSMFEGVYLHNLNLSSFNTGSVMYMNSMFENASIFNLNISNFDTSNVVDMNRMFKNSELPTLDVSNFTSNNVEDVTEMFMNASVDGLNLNNFTMNKVKEMHQMFRETQASYVRLSNVDAYSVTDESFLPLSRMFGGAKIGSADLSNFNAPNVTFMREMFADAEIDTLDLYYFNTVGVTDMSHMFLNFKTSSLELYDLYMSDVVDIYGMFQGAEILDYLILPAGTLNARYYIGMFGGTNVDIIDMSGLTINAPTEGGLDYRGMFSGSTASVIVLPDDMPFSTPTLTYDVETEDMFSGCLNLFNLVHPPMRIEGRNMFKDTPNLNGAIDVSLGGTGRDAFLNCGAEQLWAKDEDHAFSIRPGSNTNPDGIPVIVKPT